MPKTLRIELWADLGHIYEVEIEPRVPDRFTVFLGGKRLGAATLTHDGQGFLTSRPDDAYLWHRDIGEDSRRQIEGVAAGLLRRPEVQAVLRDETLRVAVSALLDAKDKAGLAIGGVLQAAAEVAQSCHLDEQAFIEMARAAFRTESERNTLGHERLVRMLEAAAQLRTLSTKVGAAGHAFHAKALSSYATWIAGSGLTPPASNEDVSRFHATIVAGADTEMQPGGKAELAEDLRKAASAIEQASAWGREKPNDAEVSSA